jgi:hypothetical protein
MLTLQATGLPDLQMEITTKLKSRLGDIDSLEKEISILLERGSIRSLVEKLHEDHGGLEARMGQALH